MSRKINRRTCSIETKLRKQNKRRIYKTPPPVTQFPELLPLHDPNLPWSRFEAFCESFVSGLPGVKQCHRYGRQGSRQKGIDIFADFQDGKRWVFQCKQRRRFTKGQAEKAIKKTTYTADSCVLLLSIEVGSPVRDVCDKKPNWDVWDVGDISRKVRELPVDIARRLVYDHFGPEWRNAFLSPTGSAPFVSAKTFFRPLLKRENLFNHTWTLVGRANYLKELHDFLMSDQQCVAILIGRGGIGKTKILHAFASGLDTSGQDSVQFVLEGVPITAESVDNLPTSVGVIAVDDAHRRDDLATLLALARQRLQRIKLILSSRPQGTDHLLSLLTQSGFDPREILRLDEVKELSRDEVKTLARQVLGRKYAHLTDQLTAATLDSPLVTVIGGQMLIERKVSPQLLELDEDFRNAVLTRFEDILVGQVGNRVTPQLCEPLLALIAASAPVRPNNPSFQQTAAQFLHTDTVALLRAIGILVESGVLLRRGRTLRITPDVLADHILHRACLTPQGQPTGYAFQIFEKFASVCPSEVLRNLAELDWRIHQAGDKAVDLLAEVWQTIEEVFRTATNSGRCRILDILKETAYYQPGRMAALVEFAMRNPAKMREDESISRIYPWNHGDVLGRLPRLLQHISYTLEYLPRCCDLLWELGRDDNREMTNPGHAIRILGDLAS